MKMTTNAPSQYLQYLVVGNGKVAKHFTHYFELLGIHFSQWDRRLPLSDLYSKLETCTHVLVLISDKALIPFIETHFHSSSKPITHFSGSLDIPGAFSAHPLQTFTEDLYSLEDYQRIPFVLTEGVEFKNILPGLPNPSFHIPAGAKSHYHALCVMGGNFTTLLWQHVFAEFAKLGLPSEIAWPYMDKVIQNLKFNNQQALTGPIQRRDALTIKKNIEALNQDSYQDIYRAFVKAHYPEGLSQ
jgi:2-dehydropantoate 2-reductase